MSERKMDLTGETRNVWNLYRSS